MVTPDGRYLFAGDLYELGDDFHPLEDKPVSERYLADPSCVPSEVILDLVARGLSNDEIAGRLHIEAKTVRNHVTHLFSKMGVTRRAAAIVQAREAGLGRETA